VWRADRPQKGRYREFYQCDADVVGSDSLNNEVELLSLIDYVMRKLGIRTCIHVNNRKILTGIAEIIGESDKIVDITVAIDKSDKIGIENVNAELREKGLSEKAIESLRPLLELDGSNEEKLEKLSEILAGSEIGMKGIEEMKEVISGFENLGHSCGLDLDVSLARGLNYYTGTIIEVKALDVEIGSITGGGRYDNLTGVFGVSGLSGVGISFGADRIYDVLNSLNLYPEEITGNVKALFINFGKEEAAASMKCVKALREAGISAELYPDMAKMKKQMQYANSEGVKYVVMIGDTELAEATATVKNMADGTQVNVPQSKLVDVIC
ncbi:MAG: histidine--tRNA ligase, partial [Muribaculaceae bacterium]|nr:histidine--tRNA ligase [Muribaculaceae bacterium]